MPKRTKKLKPFYSPRLRTKKPPVSPEVLELFTIIMGRQDEIARRQDRLEADMALLAYGISELTVLAFVKEEGYGWARRV